MKNRIGYAVVAAFSSVMLLATAALSGEEAKMPPSDLSEDGWISDGASLEFPWWTRNPKKLEILPEPLLYHLELSYSYMDSDGNVDMERHSGNAQLLLRKHTLTSDTRYRTSYSEIEKKLKPNASSILVESQRFLQEFRLAVLDNMALMAGLIMVNNNSSKYIDKRLNYYGGLLYTPIATPKFLLNLEMGYGQTDTSYMNESVPVVYNTFQPVDDYDSDNVFLGMKLYWSMTDKITFSEEARYTLQLEETDYYYWEATTKLDFKLSDHISFYTEYEIIFDNNSFVESVQDYLDARRRVGDPAGEMDDTNTTLSVGIKLSF